MWPAGYSQTLGAGNEMQTSSSIDPHDFLSGPALSPNKIEARYPNARRILKGGLFISHDGRDFPRIRETVVNPVIYDRFMDGFFLHNRKSGGSEEYKELVRTALYYLDKFLLVVSTNSLANRWVHAEVSVAIGLCRPIIQCIFDYSDPKQIHNGLGRLPWYRQLSRRVYTVDFRGSLESAQADLARRLDQMLSRSPYERNLR